MKYQEKWRVYVTRDLNSGMSWKKLMAVIEVEYYTPVATGSVDIEFKNGSNYKTPVEAGQWITHTVEFSSADSNCPSFDNGWGPGDFKIMFEATQGYIYSVKVKKVDE